MLDAQTIAPIQAMPDPRNATFVLWLKKHDDLVDYFYSRWTNDRDNYPRADEFARMIRLIQRKFGDFRVGQVYINFKRGFHPESLEGRQLPENELVLTVYEAGYFRFEKPISKELEQYILSCLMQNN